jgi:hypothetical protein
MLATTSQALSALILLLQLILSCLLSFISYVIFYLLCPPPARSARREAGLEVCDSASNSYQKENDVSTTDFIDVIADRARTMEEDGFWDELNERVDSLEQQDAKEISAMEAIDSLLAEVEEQIPEIEDMEVIDNVLNEVEQQIQVTRRNSEEAEADAAEKRRRVDEIMREGKVEKALERLEERRGRKVD